jgi:fructose-1,6-bisphosphatase/inositol monophosphatase family enzyme
MTRDAAADNGNLAHDLQYAIELARGAGRIVLEHYGKVERLTKTHAMTTGEAVTDADRASQRFIVAGLRRRYPTDGLVGEENDTGSAITFDAPNPDGRVWVIDPIDGTNNFVAGLGAFAVCIGLLVGGRPVLGVVYDVTRDLAYAAAEGQGAWLGNQRLRVSPASMDDAALVMLTSNLLDKDGKCPPFPTRWLAQTNWKLRILGSAALEAIQVAAGVAQAAITMNGKLWDVVAPAAVLLEAGGVLTDPSGRAIFPYDLRGYSGAKVPFIATTPAAQSVILDEVGR